MNTEYKNKTIALAGIHQALLQVQACAWHGRVEHSQTDICLLSLFQRDPDSYAEVYGQIGNLRSGLEALKDSFTLKHDALALERAKYMINLLMLSKKVRADEQLGQQIGTTLSLLDDAASDIQQQRSYIIERLAQLYQNAISPLTPRVIVHGEPTHLQIDSNAASIRAMLLAGLRACLLWYQAGGSQINLLLGKSKYLNTINQLLE